MITAAGDWDIETDLLVIGSGGGLVGALRAAAQGMDVIVAEKSDKIGGSTGMSGGVVWIPDNPLMKLAGVPDSLDDARAYFRTVAGPAEEAGPGSTEARREVYLETGPEMVEFLLSEGVPLRHCEGYSDYYSGVRGVTEGRARSRSVEADPFDTRQLGQWADRLRPPVAGAMVMYTYEAAYASSPMTRKGATTLSAVMARTARGRITGKKLVTNGAALIGHVLKLLLDRGATVWPETPLVDLILEDGEVVGALLEQDGREIRVRARGGVVITAGGFSHNQQMREEFGGKQPGRSEWSNANPGDTGEAIQIATKAGAALDMMDEAWWLPSWRTPDGSMSMCISERSKPHSIMVDSAGRRYFNEAVAYQEAGQCMFRHDVEVGGAVPSWLVIDSRHRSRYVFGFAPPRQTPKEWITSGAMIKADSLGELARRCGIDPATLTATVARFNEMAERGVDEDFHRGEGDHERYQGDPSHRPNPCLGVVAKPPFYAVPMYPGDIGTNGGIICDESARVLNEDGDPIPGLYAAGNSTASVMGRKYLGAGATIGPSVIFSYVAADNARERIS